MAESDAVPKPAPNTMPDIEAHGLVGNMQTTAYVSTAGSVDFMCFPRFDSPTVFASLPKPGDGGSFDIAPELRGCKVKQLYLPETNVLLTRFMTPDAVCEIVDFMPVIEERPGEEPQANCLIRIVKALYGDELVAGFSRSSNLSASHAHAGFLTVRAKSARVHISGRIE